MAQVKITSLHSTELTTSKALKYLRNEKKLSSCSCFYDFCRCLESFIHFDHTAVFYWGDIAQCVKIQLFVRKINFGKNNWKTINLEIFYTIQSWKAAHLPTLEIRVEQKGNLVMKSLKNPKC